MSTFLANQAVDMEVLPELALFLAGAGSTLVLPNPPLLVAHNGAFSLVLGVSDPVLTIYTFTVLKDGSVLYELADMTLPFSETASPYGFFTLALAGNNDVIGSNFDDNLIALGGDDGVRGRRGNDTLAGGLGNDSLSGEQGEDRFLFDTALGAANIDTITDFSHKEGDRIILDDLVFAEVGAPGVLGAKVFNTGKKAADKNDRIIFNEKKGALFYDHDGKGGDAQVQFAILDKKTDLSAVDILVI